MTFRWIVRDLPSLHRVRNIEILLDYRFSPSLVGLVPHFRLSVFRDLPRNVLSQKGGVEESEPGIS